VKWAIYYASELLSYWFCNVIRPTNDSPLNSLFLFHWALSFLSDYSTPFTPTYICHFDSPDVLGLQCPPLSPPFSYIKQCYCFEQSRLERRERESPATLLRLEMNLWGVAVKSYRRRGKIRLKHIVRRISELFKSTEKQSHIPYFSRKRPFINSMCLASCVHLLSVILTVQNSLLCCLILLCSIFAIFYQSVY